MISTAVNVGRCCCYPCSFLFQDNQTITFTLFDQLSHFLPTVALARLFLLLSVQVKICFLEGGKNVWGLWVIFMNAGRPVLIKPDSFQINTEWIETLLHRAQTIWCWSNSSKHRLTFQEGLLPSLFWGFPSWLCNHDYLHARTNRTCAEIMNTEGHPYSLTLLQARSPKSRGWQVLLPKSPAITPSCL